jgi:hypothetical protein
MKSLPILVAAASLGCSSSNAAPPAAVTGADAAADQASANPDGARDQATASPDATADQTSALEDFAAQAADFDCNRNSEWTAVGFSHYKNALGHTTEMLAVARSSDGGVYPVGTVVQLNPAEAMVKRGQGFSDASADWEFFTLVDSDAGTTTITNRGGGASVSNRGGTCLGCHAMAPPQWDLICGDVADGGPMTAHGCNPLPVPAATLAALPDPRCP